MNYQFLLFLLLLSIGCTKVKVKTHLHNAINMDSNSRRLNYLINKYKLKVSVMKGQKWYRASDRSLLIVSLKGKVSHIILNLKVKGAGTFDLNDLGFEFEGKIFKKDLLAKIGKPVFERKLEEHTLLRYYIDHVNYGFYLNDEHELVKLILHKFKS